MGRITQNHSLMCQPRVKAGPQRCAIWMKELINYLQRRAISSWGGLQRWALTYSVAVGLMLVVGGSTDPYVVTNFYYTVKKISGRK